MTTLQPEDRGEVLLYRTEDGRTALDVRLTGETVWLTLNQMVDLLGRDKSVISRHLRNIFESKELSRKAVVAKNATTAADGKTYQVDYYSLDAIISVGYRVNSKRGTQFRIWATQTLKDHLIRGYTVNERRLREKGLTEAEQIILRFSPERARWVAEVRWHPEQKGRYDGNHYLLEIPYSDDRELVLDILKHGPDVEVLRPKSLRDRVLEQHLRAVEQYQKATPRSHRVRQRRS